MKKWAIVFECFLLISLASAVEIKLTKEVYAPGETLQAEIYGSFLENLKVENIHFYRERNIPVEYDLLKVGDKYLLYALLPQKEGNYSLKIEDARYPIPTGISTNDIVKEFSIAPSNKTVISFSPGFVVATEDFEIRLYSTEAAEVKTDFLNQTQTVSLSPYKEERAYFSISGIQNYTETKLKIGDYSIPVFVFPERTDIPIEEAAKFRFSSSEFDALLLKGETYLFVVELINFGRKNITDINLSSNFSKDVSLEINPEQISELPEGDSILINLTLKSSKKGVYYGELSAVSEDISTSLSMKIEVTENQSAVINNTGPTPGISEENCSSIDAIKCDWDKGESCTKEKRFTLEGYCCMGECVVKGSNDYGWVVGVIIIILVLAGIGVFLIYLKRRQKPIDVLKQREKNFEERMKGEEVRERLSKE